MLYGRDTENARRIVQRQRNLIESDASTRSRGRRARSTGTPEDHVRHTVDRIRNGEDPHQVGLDLHRNSPDGHAMYVGDETSPHRTTVAAAPHLHAWNTHEQAYDDHASNTPETPYNPNSPDWEEHNRTGGELLHKRWKALRGLEHFARRNNVDVQHLIRPRHNEAMHDHMRRLMSTTVMREARSQNRGTSRQSEPGKHVAVFDYEGPANRLAASANAHWGHSHDTKIEKSKYSPYPEWRVTTTKKQG